MHKNIFAYTEPGFEPAFVSLNRDDGGRVSLSVREGPDNNGGVAHAEVRLPPEQLSQLFVDLARDIAIHSRTVQPVPFSRGKQRNDGWPTRHDIELLSPAELVIFAASRFTEAEGASLPLTHAVTLLSMARDRVADHVETTTASP